MRLRPSSVASPLLEYLVRQLDAEKRQAILSLLEPKRGARMLDCGCGDGGFAVEAAQKVGATDIFGVEILQEDVERATARGIQACLGDLNLGLPFADESFDVVLVLHVIEHLYATDLFLKEVHRVLRVGGYAILQTPNLAAWHNVVYLLFGKQPVEAQVSDETIVGSWTAPVAACSGIRGPGHRRNFTMGAVKELLKFHGFTSIRSFGTGFLPLPNPLSKVLSLVDKWHTTDITTKARKGKPTMPPADKVGSRKFMIRTPPASLGRGLLNYWARQAELEYQRGILALMERHPEARFLDCGCGDGEFTQRMAEEIGTRDIHSIDVVVQRTESSREGGINVFHCGLNEKLPFSDESFDVVTAVQVIEHLASTDLFARELHRILRIGGYAIVVTPNLASIHNILYLFLGKQPVTASVSDEFLAGTWYPAHRSLDGIHQQASHQRVFTLGALKGLFEYHGFQVEGAMGTGFFPLPASLARVMCPIDGRHAIHIIIKARRKG